LSSWEYLPLRMMLSKLDINLYIREDRVCKGNYYKGKEYCEANTHIPKMYQST